LWIFGPKRDRDDIRGGWRKLHNEELRNFYFSPNIIRILKSRWMRLVGHVGLMAQEGIQGFLWDSQKEREY
jgi:hypothetical protein